MVEITNVNKTIKKRYLFKKEMLSWIIAIPSLLLFAFFIWGPLLQNIVYSFAKTNNFDIVSFHGFENYVRVFADPRFAQALENTLLYVVFSLIIGFLIPILLALLISEVIRTKSFFKVGFYIPNIVPAIAVILTWKIMMDANDYGFFNIVLSRLGLPTSRWISNDHLSIPLIIMTLTWKSAGATMLIYLATVQSIDNSLYEACRIKGLSVWKRLRYITIPALLPNIKLLLIIQIISIFQIFYEPMIFMGQTNDSANTLGLLIYKLIYTTQDTGQAAALGVITMLILLVFTYVYLYFDKRTNQQRILSKPYMSYEMLLAKIEQKEKKTIHQYLKQIQNVWVKIKQAIYKVLVWTKVIWLLKTISKGFQSILKRTKTFGLKIFIPKKDGILAYSDYKKSSRRIGYYIMYAILCIGMFMVLMPFIWLFFTSFKNSNEILQSPQNYTFFPSSFDFGKYLVVIQRTQIMRNVYNSLFISFGAAISAVLFNGLLAYVISVLKPKGHKFIFYLILGSMLIPPAVALVPLYTNISSIYRFFANLTGMTLRQVQSTFITLIPFWFIAGASPFNFLLFKTHFDGLPKDLFEVAELEGASKLQTFFKIIVPLSVPVMMVVAIFSVTAAWNDFLLPYIMINNQDYWTVMIKLFRVHVEMFAYNITLDQFLSLLLFTMIPPVILFFIFQKRITSNVATTGIK
ncbi:ABC transporter permease subunit [Peloplasma aerotolerans]|uniref:ABC transporter permease subunit n=1 Tax=Peloplasma aerotolerans TaxID=3044389 RepID=A0AAW6U7G5_9MOLU|nr:ABC transporter permease subunit [Mariniplasma sp. M4Ah]MDI6452549.1 ABC transporter permease subunit [Mariniplasma sp. M4Ah]